RRLLVLFCGILVSGGCAREHDEVTSVTRFNLEVVDSVQLEVMATYLSLMDVHDSTGNLLVIESDPPVVYEFDSLGQFIHRIQLETDVQNQWEGTYLQRNTLRMVLHCWG